MLPGQNAKNQIVTGASVSPDGTKFLLLTYSAVIEIHWNFQSYLVLKRGVCATNEFRVLSIALPKQEAVAYLPDGSGFIITSESKKASAAPIVGVRCLN